MDFWLFWGNKSQLICSNSPNIRREILQRFSQKHFTIHNKWSFLQCCCAKQYTDKTVDKFRSRWSNYKDSDRTFLRGEEIKQKFLHEHFLKDDHHGFEKDVSICLIDKKIR